MNKSSTHQPSSKSESKWMIHDYIFKQTQSVGKTLNISWNIDNKLKQRMKSSSNKTIFQSNDNQIENDSLFIIVAKASKSSIYSYPQIHFYIAINDTNNLNYAALRKHMRVKYTLTCYQLNINQTNTFTFNETHTNTSKQKLNTEKLSIRKCHSKLITINATIELLDLKVETPNISNQNDYGHNTYKTIDKQWDIESCNSQYENMKRECIVIGYINCIER
eukprot:254653_1